MVVGEDEVVKGDAVLDGVPETEPFAQSVSFDDTVESVVEVPLSQQLL